jgi:hypothetical protein
VELFEQIRREYDHGVGTIKGVARKLGVHRRMVREALGDAVPRERKINTRGKPRIEPVKAFIEAILQGDEQAAIVKSRLQILKRKASPFNDVFPEVNPTKAETAAAIVKYPAGARESGCRFTVGQFHWILRPIRTTTGEPFATNAESGRRCRIGDKSRP